MGKISHSDIAPNEPVHYSFPSGEFDLGGKVKSFKTDNRALLNDADQHPALDVEFSEVPISEPSFHEQISPEDDALSAVNSVANDAAAVVAAKEEEADETITPVAIAAGLPQTEVVEVGPVAETLAADPTSKTSTKKGSN